MCITEYNEEKTLNQKLEEGIEKGKAEEKNNIALKLLTLGTISMEDISKATGITLDKVQQLAAQTNLAID